MVVRTIVASPLRPRRHVNSLTILRSGTVPIDGGFNPAWHPNGRELFFLDSRPDRFGPHQLMSAAFDPGPPPRIGHPTELFSFDWRDPGMGCVVVRCFDVAPDGQRFHAVQWRKPPASPLVTSIKLIQNFFGDLKAKVPPGR
jgi:hypothetical protein